MPLDLRFSSFKINTSKFNHAHKVIDALGVDNAMYVGGCVRNAVIGSAPNDVDIATKLKPAEVMEKLKLCGVRTIPTGLEHGTVTAVIDKQNIEITTLRRDIETDGRRAVVGFTDNWRKDAERRDFTMNTLLASRNGDVFDLLGCGIDDAKSGRIVFVGEPKSRISEDYLRILRFFRMHAYYGKGEPDSAALIACKNAADKITLLSKERVTQEFIKILSRKNATKSLKYMSNCGVLLKLCSNLVKLENIVNLQEKYDLVNLSSRICALDISAKDLAECLILPKRTLRDIELIKTAALLYPNSPKVAREAAYRYGKDAAKQAILFCDCDAKPLLEVIDNWDIPNPPVSAKILLDSGKYKQGKELGEALKKAEEDWINSDFKN